MSRIAPAFEQSRRERRVSLIGYLTIGYPTLAATMELVPALLEGGFDAVELGVPFSDPIGAVSYTHLTLPTKRIV